MDKPDADQDLMTHIEGIATILEPLEAAQEAQRLELDPKTRRGHNLTWN